MEPSPSPEPVADRLAPEDADLLFLLADAAIRAGLDEEAPPPVDEAGLPPALAARHGAFVTLHVAGELNGCIGTLDPTAALGVAVPGLAWQAAFADPRLPALTAADYDDLDMHVSVLGPLVPVPARRQVDVVAQLRPGVDGLVIADQDRRATFLPVVWEKVADADAFVDHLQRKAGLPVGRWTPDTRAWRYTVAEYRRSTRQLRRPSRPDPSAAASAR